MFVDEPQMETERKTKTLEPRKGRMKHCSYVSNWFHVIANYASELFQGMLSTNACYHKKKKKKKEKSVEAPCWHLLAVTASSPYVAQSTCVLK